VLLLGTLLLWPALVQARDGQVLRDIPYVEKGEQRQRLDLYLPENGRKRPLVIWIHGGAWRGGDKAPCPADLLTKRGYAVACINYRLSQHALFPAQIEDCRAAVRWLRAHAETYGLDPDRIGAWGASAGGHLAALLGTTEGGVRVVCDLCGPKDLVRLVHQVEAGGPLDPRRPDSPASLLLGGVWPANAEESARASPIMNVSPGDAPTFILHGDKDPIVPVEQSRSFFKALKDAGVEAQLQVLPGAGHGGPEFLEPRILESLLRFFDRHLKGRPAGK